MAVLCLCMSTKGIVMNNNEFEYQGKIYVSVESNGCSGCAFCIYTDGCYKAPSCDYATRTDGVSVVFVEKQQ